MAVNSPITSQEEWFKGEHKLLVWSIDDGEDPPSVPTGMASWTIAFVMRQTPDYPDEAITKTATVTEAGEGTVQVEIMAEDTEDLPSGNYFYTLKRTNAGNETDLAYGAVVLKQPAV